MGIGTLTLLGMMWAPGQVVPADVHPFNQAKMDIPIRYDPAKRNEIRNLLLFVSRNQGESWEQYAVASPDKDTFFTFTPPSDGVYWFQMMIVDKQGRRDPVDLTKAPVGLKVLIDTKSPVITIKSVERSGNEAIITWDIQEANPDWNKFQIDYRLSDGSWIPVQAKASSTGSAVFHVASSGPMTVRVLAQDMAGNRSEMTKDVAAPVNVASFNSSGIQQSAMRVGVPTDVAPPSGGINGMGDPAGVPIIAPTDPPMTPVKTQEKSTTNNVVPPPGMDTTTKNEQSGSPLAVSPQMNTFTSQPLPPAQVINVARFDIAYDVEQKGPSGLSKAEVWVTRDEGKSWQKWSTTEKTESPITVDLAVRNNPQPEGVYGLKIVLLSGAGLSKGPPVSGDMPDMRVDVDLTPPVVKIYEPIPDPNQKDTMILRWHANDRNLANDPITLEWSEQADGPWNPIVSPEGGVTPVGSSGAVTAKRLANTGQFSWRLPTVFPTHRVFLRVTARDTAGNIAEAHTPHAILVDMNKPVAKIHGIIGATPSDKR